MSHSDTPIMGLSPEELEAVTAVLAAEQLLTPWGRLNLAVQIIRGVIDETETPAVVKYHVIEKVKNMEGISVDV